eukprot:SAG31_NODE_1337_length_8738_cov_2.840954_8_plen_97_part_00
MGAVSLPLRSVLCYRFSYALNTLFSFSLFLKKMACAGCFTFGVLSSKGLCIVHVDCTRCTQEAPEFSNFKIGEENDSSSDIQAETIAWEDSSDEDY